MFPFFNRISRKFLWLTLLCLMFTASVDAHLLGASHAECVALFGEPESCHASDLPPAAEACAFRKGRWGTIIHFWDRRAHCITSVKLDGTELTQAEIQATLSGFGEGQSWVKDARGEIWRSDQQMVASIKGNTISIFSAEFYTAAVLRQAFH